LYSTILFAYHPLFKKRRFFFSPRSGYDHVLLESYLVPYLFEKRFHPKLERRGNKLTTIRTRTGITFRDVTKLLAPSINLRKFGDLFLLKQKKAYFPFPLLNSVYVLRWPKLPTDPAAWKSDLSGSPAIGPDEIAEAQALFEEAGCKSLGDYLRAYLKLDVDILYLATQEWRRSLKRLVGIDFVESSKFTISSLSNLGGQKCLSRHLRLGNFFPNNSQHYRLLRNGMRG